MTHPIEAQIECVKREIQLRKRFYRSWVRKGNMKQEDADYEIACMEEVLLTLEKVKHAAIPLLGRVG